MKILISIYIKENGKTSPQRDMCEGLNNYLIKLALEEVAV
jgi:hypothetical protein